jgi:L-iditol 2-dehydrogenase
MRVARLHAVGDLRLSDEPTPEPGPGDVLVRVTVVGVCGSDLHWFGEGGIGDAQLSRPLVLGHEFAGVVESGPLAGTRVAVDPADPCEVCESCQHGHQNLCPNVRFAGHGQTDGALREYLTWPQRLLHQLPDGLSDAAGAALEPLGVAMHALDLAQLRTGETVAVIGAGPIGLLLIQLARAAGAALVVAVEPREHRQAAALRFGADHVWAPTEASDGIVGVTAGRGVDLAVEIAGPDEAVDQALRAVRPGARVVLAGIPDVDRTALTASLARRKGLTLLFSRRMNHAYPRAIAMAQRGLVQLEPLLTERFPLTQAPAAFAAAARREGLKTVVEVAPGTVGS